MRGYYQTAIKTIILYAGMDLLEKCVGGRPGQMVITRYIRHLVVVTMNGVPNYCHNDQLHLLSIMVDIVTLALWLCDHALRRTCNIFTIICRLESMFQLQTCREACVVFASLFCFENFVPLKIARVQINVLTINLCMKLLDKKLLSSSRSNRCGHKLITILRQTC